MKCLVINLDRSADRLAHITSEFARIGVAFERIAAIGAADRPNLTREALPKKGFGALRMTATEYCCFLSHRACWKIIADGEDRYGAIFEDDVVFAQGAGLLLADHGWIPRDAGIVKLETFFKTTVIDRASRPASPGFAIARLRAVHLGAAGYILSRQAAADLLARTENFHRAVDQALFNPVLPTAAGRTVYQVVPALCAQDHFLGSAAIGLGSLLKQERRAEWLASDYDRERKGILERIRIGWMRARARLRNPLRTKRLVIPFDPDTSG